jgi:hypothetical protein
MDCKTHPDAPHGFMRDASHSAGEYVCECAFWEEPVTFNRNEPMITLKQFFETFDYRVTEGSEFGWSCYGPYAYSLTSWNGKHDAGGVSGNITFDTRTQTVYEVEVCDYTRNRAYRLINPAFVTAHKEEAEQRSASPKQAWDDVDFVDLDVELDWLEKAQAIIAGKDYDTRVQLPLTLDDDLLFELMKRAHEQDITLNQLVEKILKEYIKQHDLGLE